MYLGVGTPAIDAMLGEDRRTSYSGKEYADVTVGARANVVDARDFNPEKDLFLECQLDLTK